VLNDHTMESTEVPSISSKSSLSHTGVASSVESLSTNSKVHLENKIVEAKKEREFYLSLLSQRERVVLEGKIASIENGLEVEEGEYPVSTNLTKRTIGESLGPFPSACEV
jgi:hypothetical protein